MENLITVFFTGLITGGLTCMAVQGGFWQQPWYKEKKKNLKII